MKKTRSSSSQQRSASFNAGLDDDSNETEDGLNAVRGKKRKALTSTAERNAKRQRKASSTGTA